MSKNITRRGFLKITGAVGGAFLLINCKLSDITRGASETNLPQIEGAWAYSENILTLDLSKLPEIGALGGAVRIEGEDLPNPILVVLGEDGNYYAYKNVCTHLGRLIDPLAGTMKLKCSSMICKERSTYDYQGRVHSGYAEGPLKKYRVALEGDQIIVAL